MRIGRFSCLGLMFVMGSLSGVHSVFGGAADTAGSDLAALERLTGRWIGLRSEIAQEEQAWAVQQTYWEREMELLRTEIGQRQASLQAEKKAVSGDEQMQADLLAETEQITDMLQGLEAVLSRYEAKLLNWQDRIPGDLQLQAGIDFQVLLSNGAAAARVGVLRRLQTILALYAQIEELQRSVHVTRSMLAVGQTKREADVLYLGLGCGFAVTSGGDWAAVGAGSEAGWSWQEMPSAAETIRSAIRVYLRDAEIRLIPLPIVVGGQP